ncbi:hypothetical protein [Salinibacterium sp. ZJ450]|nr:hypothetical protein [Salinibacterium sp. ZJ450]
MVIALLLIALIAVVVAVGVGASIRQFWLDGYRQVPTRDGQFPTRARL